jgi:hypothetical protein
MNEFENDNRKFVIVSRPKDRKTGIVRFWSEELGWNGLSMKKAKVFDKEPLAILSTLNIPDEKENIYPIIVDLKEASRLTHDNERVLGREDLDEDEDFE